MAQQNRALLILAAYDYESLAITLKTLEHTVDKTEKIVVVLNGKRQSLPGEKTERVARTWAALHPEKRFVVRPLCSGTTAWFALSEVIKHYGPLQDVTHICKIDDDIIPLRAGWLNHLAVVYEELSKDRNIGFITGLINNNCWGFEQLVDTFEKRQEYANAFNYTSVAGDFGERKVAAGKIDIGMGGTVWNYPYLAWWIHQWTSLKPADFIHKTANLSLEQIADDTHYSIGCVYFEKQLWLSIDSNKYKSTFDELLLNRHCKELGKEKWAVRDEPMIHLFYRTQRHANAALIPPLLDAFTAHFNDNTYKNIEALSPTDAHAVMEETLAELKPRIYYLHKKFSAFSLFTKWKEKKKKKMLEAASRI